MTKHVHSTSKLENKPFIFFKEIKTEQDINEHKKKMKVALKVEKDLIVLYACVWILWKDENIETRMREKEYPMVD